MKNNYCVKCGRKLGVWITNNTLRFCPNPECELHLDKIKYEVK